MNFEGETEGHISVYFSIAEADSLPVGWEVNSIFTFFVHNQIADHYFCFRGMLRRFNAISPKWGFPKLISLMDPSKGYVVDDVCAFGAEVFVIQTQRVSECLSLLKDAAAPTKRDWKMFGCRKSSWLQITTGEFKCTPREILGRRRAALFPSFWSVCQQSEGRGFLAHQKQSQSLQTLIIGLHHQWTIGDKMNL